MQQVGYQWFRTSLAMGVLTLCCATQVRAQVEETAEPSMLLSVEIDGQERTVRLGEKAQWKGDFTDPSLKVTVKPYREFRYGGLDLRYPTEFTFEADLEDPPAKIWNLSGHTVEFMVFRDALDLLTPEEMIRATASEIEGKIGEVEQREIKLGQQTLKGARAKVAVGSYNMLLEAYTVPMNGRSQTMLMFIDDWNEGQGSAEGRKLMKMLKQSFGIARKPKTGSGPVKKD